MSLGRVPKDNLLNHLEVQRGEVIGSPIFSTSTMMVPNIMGTTFEAETGDANQVDVHSATAQSVACTSLVAPSIHCQREITCDSVETSSLTTKLLESVHTTMAEGTITNASITNGTVFSLTGTNETIQTSTIDSLTTLGSLLAKGGLRMPFAAFRDQKPQGISGGTFSSGAWRTRDLNTTLAFYDPNNEIGTLSSNSFTLGPGTWFLWGSCPTGRVQQNQARIYNTVSNTTLLIGSCNFNQDSSHTATACSFFFGVFTITSQATVEVQHQCSHSYGTGFGIANNYTTEVYTQISLFKLA